MLRGKKILIGITGSIAAYKIPFLIRLLIREGAEVKVVMTKSACDFVTPLTLSVLTQNPVSIEPFSPSDGKWHSHIELGSWADLFLLAPLSANTLGKMAGGITDNLLLATYLAARCQVFFAPAMDVDMFEHPTTQMNIRKLTSFGNLLIAPQEGELASGLVGYGRMEEPENILKVLSDYFSIQETLKGYNVLITSGPTIEPIDPVRYISNHSSGLMGNALAMECAKRGARVTLVSGPVKELPQHPNIDIIKVRSADEMFTACTARFDQCNICIMAAAVSDYIPDEISKSKIKKDDKQLTLKLNKSKDILAQLGKQKKPSQVLVGFALETDDEITNAKSKLNKKNLDFVVLNSLKDKGAGFAVNTNKITILDKSGKIIPYDLKTKVEVAADIIEYACTLLA